MWPARCASCSVIACSASSSSTTTCASSIACSVLMTENFSMASNTLPRRLMPAVSISVYLLAAALEIEVDRVARRAGLVEGDHPLLAQDRVDQRGLADVGPADDRHLDRVRALAVLGRRAGASSFAVAARRGRARARSAAARSRRARRRSRPARRGRARGTPRRRAPAARPSALFTARITGRPDLRRRSAITASCGVRPSRPSTMNTTTSASAIACLVCRAIACRMPLVAFGSKPPVSTTKYARSPRRARP